jgi:hypothetical protein
LTAIKEPATAERPIAHSPRAWFRHREGHRSALGPVPHNGHEVPLMRIKEPLPRKRDIA